MGQMTRGLRKKSASLTTQQHCSKICIGNPVKVLAPRVLYQIQNGKLMDFVHFFLHFLEHETCTNFPL